MFLYVLCVVRLLLYFFYVCYLCVVMSTHFYRWHSLGAIEFASGAIGFSLSCECSIFAGSGVSRVVFVILYVICNVVYSGGFCIVGVLRIGSL